MERAAWRTVEPSPVISPISGAALLRAKGTASSIREWATKEEEEEDEDDAKRRTSVVRAAGCATDACEWLRINGRHLLADSERVWQQRRRRRWNSEFARDDAPAAMGAA